ncbi:MAG: fibronectin type III domain-containing protein, partial [Candidatus Omnitrophica bacterium]|nr:fibronectin type III domain-containing protein [Candidatus Omnitrophota bacterium]
DNFSVYEVEDNSQREVKVNFGSESENVKITLVDPRWFTADECYIKTSTGTQSFWFDDKDEGKDDTTNGPGLYFAKIEQKEMGVDYYTKEIRIYFEIVNKFIPEGDILLIDDDQPRRYTTYPNDPWYQSEVYSGFPHYPDVESYYEEALQGLGINRVDMGGTGKKYKVWHVENKDGSNASGQGRHGEVTYEILSNYIGEGKLVIWFTGNDWLTTIKQKEQEAITQFLNNGGRLFITGQDIGYNLSTASPAFYRNILKSTLVQDNIRLFDIDGINIDDLSGELKDINITSGDGAYNQHWPSEIDPQVGASTILLYDPAGAGGGSRMSSGTAGIRYYDQNTGGALVYFAFGFEAINNFEGQSNGRKAVLEKVINYLLNPTPSGLFKAVAGDQKIYLYWLWPNQRDTNILILYKEQTGYPTGIPQNGQTYTKGQQIGDGIVEFVGSFPTTSYEHTGLVNDRTYYYAAYVYDTATKTYKLLGYANATPRAGSEPGEIPKPTNLTATPRYIENINMWVVDLSWQDNSEDEYEEDGFAIERKIDDGDFQEIKRVGRDTTSYTDDNDGSGLEENRTYTYRVRAYKGMQYSKYSNEATTMTVRPGKPIPVSPKNQINVPLTPQLVAQYEHPLGLPLVGSAWQIRKQDGTIVYNVESGAQTTHQVPPGILQFNTDYWWRVRFRDANWWSDWSDEAYFKTRGNSPPNKPSCISPKNVTGISITPTLRSSTFTDPDGDNIKYAKWYIREDNNGSPGNIKWQGQNSPNPNSPSITVPPNILQYETKYWWSVQYSDIFDAWSEEADYVWFITETPPPPQPPYKPQNISVDGKTYNGAENISLTPTLKASPFSDPNPNDIFSDSHWQIAVVNDKNQDGSYREVYWEKYGGATNTIKVDNPPLQPNTKYYWHVRYKDSTGLWSEWSDEWYFITGSGTEGGEVGAGGGCFIASVCFGEDSWQVKVLREFRDRILIKSYPGKKFVSFYYRNSPKIADFIKGKKFIFYAVRISLYPLIFLVILILYGILPYLIFISGILLLLKSLLKNTLRK